VNMAPGVYSHHIFFVTSKWAQKVTVFITSKPFPSVR
jgi:hypothetical protein